MEEIIIENVFKVINLISEAILLKSVKVSRKIMKSPVFLIPKLTSKID